MKMIYHYKCVPVRVVDGDTVELVVDLGFNTHLKEIFRLEGINAPEQNTDKGVDATAFLERTLFNNPEDLQVVSFKHGKYRWLAELFISSDSSTISVNDLMVEAGHAEIYK